MSQKYLPTIVLTPANTTEIEVDIVSIHVIADPLIVSITSSQRKALLIVGTSREAEIDGIETGLMESFDVTIPKDMTLVKFRALKQEQKNCTTLAAKLTVLASIFKNRADVIGNDRMLIGIEALDEGRKLGKTSTEIAEATAKITTDHLTPSGVKGLSTMSIAPAANTAITGLKAGKRIINNGTTIISALVINGDAASALIINPGDSVLLPKGWINVTMTNLSATTAGSFQVYKK